MRVFFLLMFFFSSMVGTNFPFELTFQGETISLIDRDDFIIGELIINNGKLNELINELEKQVYQQPINASIDKHGKISQEQIGHKLDQDKFKEMFYDALYNNRSSHLEVPIIELYPKVDSELLANIYVKQIGRYLTYFNKRNKARTHNISLATEAINNHVVFPGEVFSFNEVVGKRTVEKGYLPAPVIIRGKVYKDIGGGICQVSSTLFNAVDLAGVKILERYSHSKRVRYVPSGRDATVSWYGPDFTFENDFNQPIVIRAQVYSGLLMIIIYSSEIIDINKNNINKGVTS